VCGIYCFLFFFTRTPKLNSLLLTNITALFFLESDLLNRYIIDELHRNGVDLCNKALTRLLSKRERRENENKLSMAQKKLCRVAAVDMWDVRVVELCDLVREVDSKVTSFQKDVERDLQLAVDDDCNSVEDEGDSGDAFAADDSDGSLLESQHRSSKRRTKSDNDQHPHASRKRKQLSGPRRQQGSIRNSYSIDDSGTRNSDAAMRRRRPSSTFETAFTDRTGKNGTVERIGADCTTSFEPVDFVGDMDDLESDHDDSCHPGRSHIGGSMRNTNSRHQISDGGSFLPLTRGGSRHGLAQRTRPMADTMSEWLDRQETDRAERRENSSKRNTYDSQIRRASSTGQRENGPQTARSRISDGDVINGGRASSSTLSRGSAPTIPHELSPKIVFDSIFDNINRDDEDPCMNSGTGRSLAELCLDMKDRYPTNMHSCRNILVALCSAVLSSTREDVRKEDIVTLFRTLLSIFQTKCTTLLDIIQNNSDHSSFQIECWGLVFRMFEKKMHEKLCQQDGLIFKVFGNRANLANHLLLQIVDAIYSQLSWEEYGQPLAFNSQLFEELSLLCIRIGYVVPLLSSVCELLTRKLGMPRWRVSLINDQKENVPKKTLFVSAIDPCIHKRLMTLGDYPIPAQGLFIVIFRSLSNVSFSHVSLVLLALTQKNLDYGRSNTGYQGKRLK
jgi:hypothetical protein